MTLSWTCSDLLIICWVYFLFSFYYFTDAHNEPNTRHAEWIREILLLPHLPSCLQISKQMPAKISVVSGCWEVFVQIEAWHISTKKVYDNSWTSISEVLQAWFSCFSWPCFYGTEWPRRQLWINCIWDILYETSSNLEQLPNVPEIWTPIF